MTNGQKLTPHQEAEQLLRITEHGRVSKESTHYLLALNAVLAHRQLEALEKLEALLAHLINTGKPQA